MVANAQSFDYYGTNDPITDLVAAPVGAFYRQNGTGVVWYKYGTQKYNWTPYQVSASTGMIFRDDAFCQQWLSISNIATGLTTITGEAGHPGVGIMSVTSAATSDRTRILHGNASPGDVFLGGGVGYFVEYLINTTTLQDGTDRWSDRRGWIDTALSVEPTNGAYFEYDLAARGNGNWWGVTVNASAYTRTDLGVAPGAGAWQKLRLEANAAGNAVRFLINDTLITTNNTNISTAAALWTASQLVKTLGTNARTVKYDYVEVAAVFSR